MVEKFAFLLRFLFEVINQWILRSHLIAIFIIVQAMPMPASVGDANGDFDFTPCVGKEKVVGFG